MDAHWLTPSYQLIAELLLHPDDRDGARINTLLQQVAVEPLSELEPLRRFLSDPVASSKDEYVQTLELSPPCPLYLGAYLFDEPTTCRGVGTSGRNAFMLEINAVYRHFGFQLSGRELSDYLPAAVEFLGISLERSARDRIGLRRRLLEQYVRPGLGPLKEKLHQYESPYALLVEALESVVAEDLRHLGDVPAWRPPARAPERGGRRLPVLGEAEPGTPRRVEVHS